MKQQLWHWTLLILLLIMPLTTAMTLEEGSLTWNGEPIEYVRPKTPMVVNIRFTLSDTLDIKTIKVDYTAMNPMENAADYTTTIDPATCIQQDDKLTCLIIGKILRTENNLIPINITASTSTKDFELSFTHELTLDDTNPKVTSIKTENCYEEQCYVDDSYTTVYIDMQDSIATFNRMRVAFNIGSKTAYVSSCEDMSCWGKIAVECNDGATLSLGIAPYRGLPSQDDAGNKIEGETRREVICDTEAPERTSDFTYEAASKLPVTHEDFELPFISIGDKLLVTFNITEKTSPTLEVAADTELFGSEEPTLAACTETINGVWTCTLTLDITPEEPLPRVTIPLTYEDLAGNKNYDELIFEVKGVPEGAPDDWEAVNPANQIANKHYMQYTSKEMFIPLTLNRKTGSPTILDVQAPEGVTCKPTKEDSDGNTIGTEADFRIEYIGHADNVVFLRGWLNRGDHYADISSATYNCSIDVLSLRGEYLNQEYETESFLATINFHSSDTMGEMVQEEIEEIMNKSEETTETLGTFRTILDTASAVCSVLGLPKATGSGLSGVAAVLKVTPLKSTGDALSTTGEKLQVVGEGLTIIQGTCNVLDCNGELFDKAMENVGLDDRGGPLDKSAEALGYDNFMQTLNPYDSYVASILRGCIPAMVYHLDQWQSIECTYAACLSQGVSEGTVSVQECQETRSYGMCTFVMGGIFNALPFTSIIEEVVDGLLEAASDPVTLFGTAGLSIACWAVKTYDLTGILADLCLVQKGISGAVQSYNSVENIINELTNLDFSGESPCDVVRRNIDSNNQYWNYYDNPASRPDLRDEGVIGGSSFSCNEITGCTLHYQEPGMNDAVKITLIPNPKTVEGDNGEIQPSNMAVFVDGVGDQSYNIPYKTEDDLLEELEERFDPVRLELDKQDINKRINKLNEELDASDDASDEDYIKEKRDLEDRLEDIEKSQKEYEAGKDYIETNGGYYDIPEELEDAFRNSDASSLTPSQIEKVVKSLSEITVTQYKKIMAVFGSDEKYADMMARYEEAMNNIAGLHIDIATLENDINTIEQFSSSLDNYYEDAAYLAMYEDDPSSFYEDAAKDLVRAYNRLPDEDAKDYDDQLRALAQLVGSPSEDSDDFFKEIMESDSLSKDELIERISASLAKTMDGGNLPVMDSKIKLNGDFQRVYNEMKSVINQKETTENKVDSTGISDSINNLLTTVDNQELNTYLDADARTNLEKIQNRLANCKTPQECKLNDDELKVLEDATKDVEKGLKKDKRQKKKDLVDEQNKIDVGAYLADYYGNPARMVMTIARFGSDFNQLVGGVRNLIGAEDALTWPDGVTDWLNDAADWFSMDTLTEEVCKPQLGKGTDSVIVNKAGGSGYTSAAHVEGVREQVRFGEDNFTYKINVYVSNGVHDKNLTFGLLLTGEEGSEYIKLPDPFSEDNELTKFVDVAPQSEYSKSKSSFIKHNTKEKYDEICIKFKSTPLKKWFDAIRTRGDESLYCRRLASG